MNADAAISQVDIAGYNYNLAQNQADDHSRVPKRIMMTTESYPADVVEQWTLVHDHPYIVGEFVWTAMDYLGESGVGAWGYGTPKQLSQNEHMTTFLRKYMANFGSNGKSLSLLSRTGSRQPPFSQVFRGMRPTAATWT
jgi:hypothetical protein